MFRSSHPKTEFHITEDLNHQHHRGDRLQSHMSLPCYKVPHTMIVTFGVCGEIELESGRICL
jgi:hypothetical protein